MGSIKGLSCYYSDFAFLPFLHSVSISWCLLPAHPVLAWGLVDRSQPWGSLPYGSTVWGGGNESMLGIRKNNKITQGRDQEAGLGCYDLDNGGPA